MTNLVTIERGFIPFNIAIISSEWLALAKCVLFLIAAVVFA